MKTVRPGIRLKENGKFLATKSIDGKRYFKEFNTPTKADNWRKNFHPLASPVIDHFPYISTASDQSNGRDNAVNFREVYQRYKNGKMKTLSPQKQYKKEKRMDRFLPPIFSLRICQITPEIITRLLEDQKLAATGTFGRSNFDEELKDLKSIFNWYKDEVDFTFHSPVMKYHKKIGFIKEVERKEKIMSIPQVLLFIDHLKDPFKTMAIIQFCAALRIGEASAVNVNTVDFNSRVMDVTEVLTWVKGVPVRKAGTKTGDNLSVEINEAMLQGLIGLDKTRPKGCIYFFHIDGKPMRYEWIQEAYNKAFKESGLHQFSGTHVLRHTMATLTRRRHGKDACQAILRHTTSRMSEHYGKLDVNEQASKVVIEAGEIFLKGRATIATSTEENLVVLES